MELVAAVDELVGIDPHALADAATVVELDRQIDRLLAVRARAVAAFDAQRAWAAEGARSAAAFLAAKTRKPKEDLDRVVRLGRALCHMPRTEAAWLRGDLGERHVAKLSWARRMAEDDFRDDEATLVEHAQLSFRTFTRRVAYWVQEHAPDEAEQDAQARRDARSFHLSQSFQGMWFGDLTLDPISGTIVHNALKAIDDELFQHDWAEARERLGRDPQYGELRRTPAQRRADALVEMATRSMSVPKGARRPKPLFTVYVGYETFAGRICELANGTAVTPGSVVPYLDEAYVERIVFDGPSRVIDVGEPRLFRGATRRAVEVRDRECYDETCEIPADEAQIDHIIPWSEQGPTRTWNGRPACGYHNRRRSRGP